ncbi:MULTISPECIES: M48 family metalloprotease [Halobacterium]|uniref:Protease HtpX homolog n=5 Tax=Halobacterium salinarum TaxID=2242 RepID=HTPX_HALSA|nr:RecName: Full=Protease HtpX homolog [Halobacterium salinarum NRC-1]AAG18751.1 heat shock protein [Halobacterium salinarum NRC-1]
MAIVGTILFAFYSVAIAAAWFFFGQNQTILAIAIVGSVVLVGVQYKVGKWMALRSVGAEDMDEQEFPRIHRRVESLSRDMGIKKPTLKVANMGVPNAFAVGRKGNGTVVVSRELIDILEHEELDGVLAHELSHIANRDVVTMQLGQGIASIVGIVAQYIVLFSGDNDLADFFLAIVVGNLVQFLVTLFVLAISRYREYVADADARRAIGTGEPLARALEKISQGNEQAAQQQRQRTSRGRGRRQRGQRNDDGLDQQVSALCISSPDTSVLQKLVSTHPPTEKRIQRLRS